MSEGTNSTDNQMDQNYKPCEGVWHGRRNPAPWVLSVPPWWPVSWGQCNSDPGSLAVLSCNKSREVQLSKNNNTSTQANHTQPFYCHSHTSCVPNITKNTPELGIYSSTFYVLKLMQNSKIFNKSCATDLYYVSSSAVIMSCVTTYCYAWYINEILGMKWMTEPDT